MSRFLSIKDLANLPTPKWLIEGMFEVGSLVMLVGPYAVYKSFMALDWSLCLTIGKTWNSKPVTQSKVLYILGEGKSNLLRRVEAWSHYHRVGTAERQAQPIVDNFRVSFEVPQLVNKFDVEKLLRDLKHENYNPDVVIIDTFARSFVGKNENDPLDTGLWIESADRLRQLGMTIIAVHHTRKNTEFGLQYRGCTTLMGGMDTAFTMQKDEDIKNVVKLTYTKQKDHSDEGEPLYFQRNVVFPHPGFEGSVVLTPITKPSKQERATAQEEDRRIDALIVELIADSSYDSDRARARELAKRVGKQEGWAQTRISRAKREVVALGDAH